MRREIDAMIHAEIRRRDRRNARFWLAALIVGIFASIAVALLDIHAPLKALLALVGFVGIFGFLALLSARKSLRRWLDDVMDWP